MDNGRNHSTNMIQSCSPIITEDKTRPSFQFSYPTNDVEECESNKSTPYFTPMEYFQNSFEFPSPIVNSEKLTPVASPTFPRTTSGSASSSYETMSRFTGYRKPSPPKTAVASTMPTKHIPSTSPNLHRKLRRFSLYERRSCSPQHLLIRNSCQSTDSTNAHVTSDSLNDKENTKPRISEHSTEESAPFTPHSGSNSPALVEDTNSPNIMTPNESRLTYSPKFLASLSNINLGGSPLGLINSAGYKTGNYFKFPEVDYVVQESSLASQQDEDVSHCDNQLQSQQKHNVCFYLGSTPPNLLTNQKARFKVDNPVTENFEKSERSKKLHGTKLTPVSAKSDKKNRKNKNNLTIKISDANNTHLPPQPSLTKPKTPTIKTTKEKAFSLDSAASILREEISSSDHQHHYHYHCANTTSDDQIKTNESDVGLSSFNVQNMAEDRRDLQRPEKIKNRSTSLYQLTTLSTVINPLNHIKSSAHKSDSESSHDWYQCQRKQNPFLERSDSTSLKSSQSTKNKSLDPATHEDSTPHVEKCYTKSSLSQSQPPPTTALRSLHKHNQLLHSSNTNLKTLPEFLTLVEFNNSKSPTKQMDADHPIKGKSLDQPNVSTEPTAALASSSFRKEKNTSNSTTNLLQRRGSNHSLTLNLHGSCGNLLGGYRSGFSGSNYNSGSTINSITQLNSKSSLNLDVSTTTNNPQASCGVKGQIQSKSQAVKQSLFSRRSSNNNLVLHLSTTSCGNLVTCTSQNSLLAESNKPAATSTSTITGAKFITPTKSTKIDSATTHKRGLLERRGSHQSLTLNMSGSHIVTSANEHSINIAAPKISDKTNKIHDAEFEGAVTKSSANLLPIACPQTHQRKFFSSENLTKSKTQFSDLNHAHKRNSEQVCFGSVSDLKPSESSTDQTQLTTINTQRSLNREQLNFQESTVCTCTGVRNITTRPLSPQTTSEEFKIYLANIQMLQNASNPLTQYDLIKFNYIFENSYASNFSSLTASVSMLTTDTKNRERSGSLLTTSEDCEISTRYQQILDAMLMSVELNDEEQKRMFRELHKEFWDLPLNHQEKPMVFGSQSKNRYKTILPNENSRVILENEWKFISKGKANEALASDLRGSTDREYIVSKEAPYINANYIKGPDFTSKCYIATQGPLPNTIFDFWLMVYQNSQRFTDLPQLPSGDSTLGEKLKFQQYEQKIVMLTNFLENTRQKCSIYFPIDLNEILFATENHVTIQISKDLEEFFNAYLMPIEAVDDENVKRNCRVNNLRVELPINLDASLPNNTSYFVIKNIGIVKKNGFSIRKFIVLYCINPFKITPTNGDASSCLLLRKFSCYHYWYPDWPDHRSPKDINTLLDICLHILELGKCEEEFNSFCDQPLPQSRRSIAQRVDQYQQDIFDGVQPLPIIHCSAGIGRTGCLIAILNAVRQVRQSLALSLISMAAAIAKTESSPVDFHLPSQFVEQFTDEFFKQIQREIDSDYARNTFLYINFISNKNTSKERQALQDTIPKEEKQNEQNANGDNDNQCEKDSFTSEGVATLQKTEFSDLPKIPDVYVDILGIVCNLRLQRGGMVQNSEQYELIHRAICLFLKRTLALKHF